ncbi:DNA adenine methylase [Planktothrix agardhii 1806]|uniref:DNA adenine methylase n=1 Tax=Planktothrix agardhii TaxID=1160 RepID=UPI001F39F1F3|nr:DNA adenine methylase [Planktothrix agardhii]MCF3603942.1 DNA adenine methylase [Planktothrix agardhii 1804]MCF3615147.1 DNA adenine methylase [Planktothrix agardhii 1806]
MNAKKNPLVKPFLKWAGGKRQLLPEILRYLPKNIGKTTYFEPFLGGGALLFELQPKQAIVNDSNRELINCYRVIKDNVEELIEVLKVHKAKNSKEYFDYLRERDRLKQYNKFSDIQKAARIIYLNKTCYNGLFRVNSKGQFNVPFGSYKNPNILDEAVLRGVNDYLNQKSVTFLNRDFAEAVKDAKKGDFVYFDPPYDPVSNTASFTGYDINGFNQNEQRRLKQVVDELTEKGCNVMLSNSATDFILDLYKDHKYTIETVSATRSINSNALKRGKINEVLVLNYVLKL